MKNRFKFNEMINIKLNLKFVELDYMISKNMVGIL